MKHANAKLPVRKAWEKASVYKIMYGGRIDHRKVKRMRRRAQRRVAMILDGRVRSVPMHPVDTYLVFGFMPSMHL